jgi:hypothetical protein
LQAQDEAAGMADDAGGEVEEPVAQRLGFGVGQWAGKQQRLGKAGEVLGGKDELEPDGVAAPPVEGEVGQAGGLGGADAVLDPGALAVPQLQPGKVRVGLVSAATSSGSSSATAARSRSSAGLSSPGSGSCIATFCLVSLVAASGSAATSALDRASSTPARPPAPAGAGTPWRARPLTVLAAPRSST